MDYKEGIIRLLEKIKNPDMLKRIYNMMSRMYAGT